MLIKKKEKKFSKQINLMDFNCDKIFKLNFGLHYNNKKNNLYII